MRHHAHGALQSSMPMGPQKYHHGLVLSDPSLVLDGVHQFMVLKGLVVVAVVQRQVQSLV